jgi:hypothetical protein
MVTSSINADFSQSSFSDDDVAKCITNEAKVFSQINENCLMVMNVIINNEKKKKKTKNNHS